MFGDAEDEQNFAMRDKNKRFSDNALMADVVRHLKRQREFKIRVHGMQLAVGVFSDRIMGKDFIAVNT